MGHEPVLVGRPVGQGAKVDGAVGHATKSTAPWRRCSFDKCGNRCDYHRPAPADRLPAAIDEAANRCGIDCYPSSMDIERAVVLSSLVAAVFAGFHKVASPSFNRELGRLLLYADPAEAAAKWPRLAPQLFDAIFGGRHFSWRCFLTSAALSVLAFAIVATVLYLVIPRTSDLLLVDMLFIFLGAYAREWGVAWMLLEPFVVFLFLLVVADYLSLMEKIGRASCRERV